MCFKIMSELLHSHDKYITIFFHLGVEFLRPGKDLQNEIQRQLLICNFVVVCSLLFNNQGSADYGVRC
jgi:hypothetical protein